MMPRNFYVANKTMLKIVSNKTFSLDSFVGLDVNISRIIWKKLDAEVSVYVNKHRGMKPVRRQLKTDKIDMLATSGFRRSKPRSESYPHGELSLCAFTQKRTSQYTTITFVSVFNDPYIMLLLVIFTSSTVGIFMLILNTNITEAFLDVIRAFTVKTTLVEPMTSLS